ncbi:MAG: DUF1697 domain-containing protein [Bacillota bacterium]
MRYVAFFRGINVGGKNIVQMAELRQLFVNLGFQDVKSYIQSGNVLFSSEADKPALAPLIAEAFETRFGFQSTVILRSDAELTGILRSLPFQAAEIARAEEQAPEVEHLYVYLSDAAIDRESVGRLCGAYEGADRLHAAEYELYLLCAKSIRESKLASLLAKLPQALTARNFKTLGKIAAMLESPDTAGK